MVVVQFFPAPGAGAPGTAGCKACGARARARSRARSRNRGGRSRQNLFTYSAQFIVHKTARRGTVVVRRRPGRRSRLGDGCWSYMLAYMRFVGCLAAAAGRPPPRDAARAACPCGHLCRPLTPQPSFTHEAVAFITNEAMGVRTIQLYAPSSPPPAKLLSSCHCQIATRLPLPLPGSLPVCHCH